jgi:ABC-type enterochelin transport system substrate-binding protein
MKMNNGRRDERRKEASERQDKRNSLSDTEQIAKLDSIFGKGKGAKKEREKLNKKIEKKGGKK